MIQRVYRLKKRGSYTYAYKNGECVATKRLAVYKVSAHDVKIGVSVGKKVGNSVVRSRVKRRISERFRLLIPRVKKGYNFVVVARSACAEATSDQINADLIYALKKHNALSAEEEC
ncbi:MAG: ribonuclease P protein component [Clostridia bacterium]|nr:ribonuclease P protein component [Clostridia bacterium]